MKVDIFTTSNKYNIIYADPPWQYNDKLKIKGSNNNFIRGAESFYSTMSLDELKQLPIENICTDDAILFMWITMAFLPKISEVMNAWGFTYKTCGFTWIKTTKNNKIHFGMGHYTRANSELCLIGVKNKKPKIIDRSISQIVISQIRKHSQKPDEIRDKIVALCGNLPRIELFARQQVEGWDCWGNEV